MHCTVLLLLSPDPDHSGHLGNPGLLKPPSELIHLQLEVLEEADGLSFRMSAMPAAGIASLCSSNTELCYYRGHGGAWHSYFEVQPRKIILLNKQTNPLYNFNEMHLQIFFTIHNILCPN